jgi:predicted regulator of Ras-like GTPase activity (Roadblock/LC7/MglB family)
MPPRNENWLLIETIDKHPAAIGWVLVGHDGVLHGQSTPADIDAESIGLWSLGIFVSAADLSKKLGHERIFQIVSRTTSGHTMIITDLGLALFITLSTDKSDETLIDLMRHITQAIAKQSVTAR